MNRCGPRQWARLRLLHACERLQIPGDRWPKIPFPEPPLQQLQHYHASSKIELPDFCYLYESERDWKAKVQDLVDGIVKEEIKSFRQRLKSDLKRGALVRIKQVHGTTPLDLRYEWAAKRLCYRYSFREIAAQEDSKGYTEERIRRAVSRIIRETGLRQGT